jgi:hypothetical protein
MKTDGSASRPYLMIVRAVYEIASKAVRSVHSHKKARKARKSTIFTNGGGYGFIEQL